MRQIHFIQITIILSFIYYIQMTEKIIKTKNVRNLQIKKRRGNDIDNKNKILGRYLFGPGGNMNKPPNQNDTNKDNQDNFNEKPTFNDSNLGDNDFNFSSKDANFSDDGENEDNHFYENENDIKEIMKEEEFLNEEENNNNEKNKEEENNEEDTNNIENINEENNKEETNITENTNIETNIEENEENINNQTQEENEELNESTNNNLENKPPDDKQEEPPDDKQDKPPDDKQEEPPDDKQDKPPDDKQEEPPDDKQEEPPDKPQDEPPDDKQEEPPDDKQDEPPDDKEDKPPDDKQDEPPDEPIEDNKEGKDISKGKDREELKQEYGPNIEKLARSGEKIKDSNYIISAVEVGSKSTLSRVDLSKCIQLLRDYGIISLSDSLIILQMDSSSQNKITSEVSYALYYSNGTQIDLSLCNNTEVTISSSVNTSMISNYDKAKSIYENHKYDIFDINDPFYNDICTSYTSDNGTDVTLKDRQDNYFESISFCDEDCFYVGYDFNFDLVNCVCNASLPNKTDSFSLNTFFKKFINVFKDSNIKLVKCYMRVFELEKLKKNIGSYIMIGLFGLELIVLIIYCETGLISTNQIYEMLIKEKEKKKNEEKKNSINEKKNSTMNGNLDITGISVQSNVNLNESHKISFKEKIKSFNISPFKQLPPYNKKISEINSQKMINNNINNNNNNNEKLKLTEKITKSIIIYSKKKYGLTSIATPRKEVEKKNKVISINNLNNNKNKNKTFILNHKRNLDNFDKDLTDEKLNKLPYEQAVEKDKRGFSTCYFSEIKNSQSFIFTFLISDGNNKYIKIILFIFNIAMYFCFNTLFFSDKSISHIYSNSGSYDFIYFIPKSIMSTLISGIINIFFKFLALNNSKKLKVSLNSYKTYLKRAQIKLGIFFLMQFLFLLFFWYFTSSFCAVYVNTQKHLFKNCIISFLFSMIFPFFYVIIITILRLVGIRKKNKILFNISKFLSFF